MNKKKIELILKFFDTKTTIKILTKDLSKKYPSIKLDSSANTINKK